MTELIIAAEVRLYREGLASSLAARGAFDVVATASNAAECLAQVAQHEPGLVLIETAMPGGLESARRIAASTRVLALAVPEEVEDVLACAEAGVSGYVTRDASLDELVAAIDAAARDELIASPRIAAVLLHRVADLAAARPRAAGAPRLTGREQEIVELLAAELSNKQIAARLSIQLSTVKNHVHNILEKLGVEHRAEAVAVAAALRGSRSRTPSSRSRP